MKRKRLAPGRREWLQAGAVVAVGGVFALTVAPHLPVLLWNATASAPLGFYRVRREPLVEVGDWVALRPAAPLAGWLSDRGYLPPHVPLLKRVAALEGQSVCRDGDRVSVDGQVAARAMPQDRKGRPLPGWCGCRRLRTGELLVLNDAPDSLDGRYFGPSAMSEVLGRAEPLWTWSGAR